MHDVAVLTATAGLPHEAHVDLVDGSGDGLAIGDLRLPDVRIDVELAPEPVDDDVEVQLAHPRDDGLPGLFVETDDERRILVRQLAQTAAQLVLVGLGLRLNGDADHGGREADLLEHHRMIRVADGVPGGGVLEADHGDDVARVRGFHVLAVVGVHLQHPPDALLAILRRVEHVGSAVEHT